MKKRIISSESVTGGHPDKVCDQISDAIVDSAIAQDANARVAIDCLVKKNHVVISGEVTANAVMRWAEIARKTIRDIGYEDRDGFSENAEIDVIITSQSPDINQGVSREDQGAGDQGMMYGYATNETPELMPLPITLAHKLVMQLRNVREQCALNYLRPDGKSQVSVVYEGNKPVALEAVVVSSHHTEDVEIERLRSDIRELVINPVCEAWLTEDTKYHINPTGRFAVGGPVADSGVTGRKIIVDTYGGVGRHGGGAFSGKDPSKVDRSGAYAARWVAKNIVAANLSDKCEVQIAYAIGVADPVSIDVDCFGTNKVDEEKIVNAVTEVFDLRPAAIIKELDLLRPIYLATASYGHFGRSEFPWEKTNKVFALLKHTHSSSVDPKPTWMDD